MKLKIQYCYLSKCGSLANSLSLSQLIFLSNNYTVCSTYQHDTPLKRHHSFFFNLEEYENSSKKSFVKEIFIDPYINGH